MQSRTSFFNKTIFKKNIFHFWPIWMGYTLFLFLMMPFRIFVSVTSTAGLKAAEAEEVAANNLFAFADALDDAGNAVWVFAVALICAMAVFYYMYSQKSIHMIHSLPVNRTQLYVTNYLSGLVFMVIPQCLTFLLTSLVCLIKDITDVKYLLYWLLMQLGMSLFAYSMAVVIGMLTGQLIVVPVFFIIANFLYMGMKFVVGMLTMQLTYGMQSTYILGKGSMLSPLYYLEQMAGFKMEWEEGSQASYLMVTGTKAIAVYALVGVLLAFLGILIYKKRRLETVGDFITLNWLKPVFRWGSTLFLSGLAVALIVELVQNTLHKNHILVILLGAVCVGIIIFFIAQMFVEKSFRVFSKKRFLECMGVQVILAAIILGVKMDVMGLEDKIPELAEVEKACLYLDFPAEETEEIGIEEVRKIHKQVLDSKEEFQEAYYQKDGDWQSLGIKYFCKDGTTLERHYNIPAGKKYLEDEDSVLNEVLDRQDTYENDMAYLFGCNYETTKPTSVLIDLYHVQSKSMESVSVGSDYVERIFEAVKQDLKAGNLTPNPFLQEEEDYYDNSLNIEYYNPKGLANIEELWYKKKVEPEGGWNSSNNIVYFSKDCENILKVLEETGLLDEDHRLITRREAELLW